MKKVYIVSKTRLGAASSTAHELLIVKFRFKLKKVGKNTRPFMHDLNQIPYDSTVEVGNRSLKARRVIANFWPLNYYSEHPCVYISSYISETILAEQILRN